MSEKELYKINDNKSQFSSIWQSITLCFCLFTSFFIGTEYVVLKTGREGFYQPFSSLIWAFRAKANGESQDVYIQGMWVTIFCIVGSFWLVHIVLKILRSKVKKSEIHGSSRFAEYEDLKEAGYFDNDTGLYFGGWWNEKDHCIEYLQDDSPTHMIVIAPPRSGKGVGIVVPNLLTFEGSIIVFDLKGENFHLTSGYRKHKLNNDILRFDPTSNNPNSVKYNPLAEVRMGLHEYGDAQAIAEMMIDPNQKGDSDHWRRSAVSLLICGILHTLYARKDKTLTGVVNLFSDPKRPVYEVLDSMLETIHDPQGLQNWKDATTKEPTKTHPIIASLAREFKNKGFEEMSGIVSTAMAFLRLYSDPIIAHNTSQSDFSIEDIINGGARPKSLYFNVPPSDLQRMVPLTRLFINQVLTRIMENKNLVLHDSENTNHRLLMMLDEFNALGKMDKLKNSLSFAAQYGVRVCLIVQDLDQIYELYGDKNPLLSYCHIRIFHATNSDVTAKRVSAMCGDTTLTKYSQSYSTGGGSNESESRSEIKRPLYMPDEVQRLAKDEMLIFVEGQYPIKGKKIIYYEDESFKNMILPPVEKSDILPVKNPFSQLTGIVEYIKPKNDGPQTINRTNPGLGIASVTAVNADQTKEEPKQHGIVFRNYITLIEPNGETLLKNLLENYILEGVSDSEVRIVGDLEENKAKIAQIAGDSFEVLWKILKKSQTKNEQ